MTQTSTAGDGPWFYPDVVSARPGDTVALHASAAHGPCRLRISRLGRESVEVARHEAIVVDDHPIPERADELGCGWPVAHTFTVGTWASGYHDLELSDSRGNVSHHFVCVRRSTDAQPSGTLLVLATNTYSAYNYWGGRNSYAHVDDLQGGTDPEEARARALGRLSRLRPLAQKMFAPPPGAPRLVNLHRRELNRLAFPGTAEFMAEHEPSPYDGAAGFVDKWEHRFAAWAEDEGIDLDYATDHDFESDPDLLAGYSTVLLVGHSEYWSGEQRRQLDEYVTDGGNLAIFSGNTGYWKVRWEDDGTTLVAHKWNGETDDPLWADEERRSEATHLWSHPAFGRPEAEVTGLSFLYGGYHRLVMCVARGSSAYTVYDDHHWALEDTDLFYGDTFGGDVPLLGYENDGCPIRFDERGLPVPDGGVGIPPNLEIIAFAPAALFEPPSSPFPPVIPPEQPDVLAEIAYGQTGPEIEQRVARGHAVLASFRKGRGEVFNSGTTEWVHGLVAGDPFVTAITRNVMARFGGHVRRTR
ncbi:MAG: N,N-dimethylformamidase beta subunit family domain-containing protein [Actinomycetota bacterium]